jgi:hypothetical protein
MADRLRRRIERRLRQCGDDQDQDQAKQSKEHDFVGDSRPEDL